MTQILLGKEVPSLKITLENDVNSDPEDFEDGEISEPENTFLPEKEINEDPKPNFKVIREFSEHLKVGAKLYENKGGAFVTGLDLSSESLIKKLEGRASRFGLEKKIENKITQQKIDALYESMGIDLDSRKNNPSKGKNFRLDTIHMRGVEEMNTNEIFYYFNEYGPASVEWINDHSCNVVWLDETSTARALLGKSQALSPQKNSEMIEELHKDEGSTSAKTGARSSFCDNINLLSDGSISDDESSDVPTEKSAIEKSSIAMDVDKSESDHGENKTTVPAVEVPVPPGYWRVGLPHKKAKALLLRFATKDDKKLPGAEKRSHYYQKYGNPNYGGLKGLISTSRKRKMLATKTKQMIGELNVEQKNPMNPGIGAGDEASSASGSKSRAKIRMRMYADDEEERQERRSMAKRFRVDENVTLPKKGSVHSRLGKKFTTTQLRREEDFMRKAVLSSDEEGPELQVTRDITVPSRYQIWTSLAKSMAEEDSRRSGDDSKQSDEDSRRMGKDSRRMGEDSRWVGKGNRQMGEDSRRMGEESRRRGKDMDVGHRRRTTPKDFISGSNRRTMEDLRISLTTSRADSRPRHEECRLPGQHKDLRSRIRQIREDGAKHRSPLLLPDRPSSSSGSDSDD